MIPNVKLLVLLQLLALSLVAAPGAVASVTEVDPARPAGALEPFGPAPLPAMAEDQTTGDDAGEDAGAAGEGSDEEPIEALTGDDLTLERLFPEKSPFGPSARAMAFSHDGRWGAYLYRPRIERRHGNDLWLFDSETGETRRVTKVSVMSEFQADTREVRDHRIEQAKKSRKGGGGSGESKDGEADAKAPADGISGAWTGRMRSGGSSAEGVEFSLVLERGDDGAITGRLESDLIDGEIRSAELEESGDGTRLEARLRDAASQMDARLAIRIEGEDGAAMTGTLTVDDLGLELELEGRWTGGAEAAAKGDGGGGSEQDLGDVVSEKDAEDSRAPRYGGISSFTWSPVGSELIFTSGGDLYRYDAGDDSIVRLTRTRGGERSVQYLPNGSGYAYLLDGGLFRVRFGEHVIHQLDPQLPRGETMTGYEISPDGEKLVFLASKGESWWTKGRQVNIVNYRNRFAEVRQVTRHMPDDPMPTLETMVYLFELTGHLTEEGRLERIHRHVHSGPRDSIWVPEWAPDSSKVAFSTFTQDTGLVSIYQSGFEPEVDRSGPITLPGDEQGDEADADEDDGDEEDGGAAEDGDEDEEADEPTIDIVDAKLVYQFFHNGGPNTPRMIQPFYLADNRHLVFIAELSGFRHLHVLDPVYEQLDQLTSGRFEVYPIDISPDHTRMDVLANDGDPSQQHVASVDLETGTMTRLSPGEGYYGSAAVSPGGDHVLTTYVDFGSLNELYAVDVEAAERTPLTDSHTREALVITKPVPTYFSFENRHGQTIHGHMFAPSDLAEGERRPMLLYVYGGPLGTRKMVTRGSYARDSYYFAYYMAEKHGWITCTVDPRGASGYGGLFEKSNFEQVGKPQVEDLVDAARWMVEHQPVDPTKLAMHGWSFGGFQTQMTLYTEPEVFAAGIAGAGPTEWENYNSWYSTGTIGPSRTGKTDLSKYSLLPLAKNLEARLLLVHGMEDSNVLYQDTVRVYQALLKAGKEALVDLFLDPTGGHGLGGDVKTVNRFRKYEAWLLDVIGSGRTDDTEDDEDDEGDDDADDGEA